MVVVRVVAVTMSDIWIIASISSRTCGEVVNFGVVHHVLSGERFNCSLCLRGKRRRAGSDVNRDLNAGAGGCVGVVVEAFEAGHAAVGAALHEEARQGLGRGGGRGSVQEAAFLGSVASALQEVRTGDRLFLWGKLRAEVGLSLLGALALAARLRAELELSAASSVISVAAAKRLVGLAGARAKGAVAGAGFEAELAGDCIVLRDLVGERMGVAPPLTFSSANGKVTWPLPVEEWRVGVEGAGADMHDALIARGAQVGDGRTVAVEDEESSVFESLADVAGLHPAEAPLVAEMEAEMKGLAVGELAIKRRIKLGCGVDAVAGERAWDGGIFSNDGDGAL